MAIVYSWPPVAAISKTWNLDAPISKSYSMVSGRRFASAVQMKRRRVKITVAGMRNNGRGYMAALERYLEGGVNFVRLTSCRLAFGLVDLDQLERSGEMFTWRETSDVATEFDWAVTGIAVDPFVWYEGVALQIRIIGAGGGLNVEIQDQSLTPGSVVALPGEFLTVITAAHPEGETHMISNVVTVRADKSAVIRLVTPLSGPGQVNFNTSETGIFELNSEFPDLGYNGATVLDMQLEFREVLPEEIPEGIEESNRWT